MKKHQIQSSIVINAPIESVWSVLTNFNQWQQWQKQVTAAKIESDLEIGAVFHWKAGGMRITSTITAINPPQMIIWSGKAMGTQALHSWKLESHGAETVVTSEEVFSGWLAALLGFLNPSFFAKSLRTTLQELKTAAEKV